jgi:integrase
MKMKYRLFQRNSRIFFIQDNATGRQESLKTRDRETARRIFNARNEAHQQPAINLQIARAYLMASDPAFMQRTWQNVMDQIQTHGRDSTKTRYVRGMKSSAFDSLRHRKLLETNAEDFFAVLKNEQMSVGHYLRRLHNLALNLGWLPVPVLIPKLWPKPQCKSKRGITPEEHQRILDAEKNAERNLFYQLLWEIGASQSDAAALTAEDIDWPTRTLSYFRMKTGEHAQLAIGKRLETILNHLPITGPLFPTIFKSNAGARAAEFRRRCKLLGIQGISLHSYRYAWAERAKTCGYPERFAQEALGHNSVAVHRAYAKRAKVKLPSLEEYERKFATLPNMNHRENPVGIPIKEVV